MFVMPVPDLYSASASTELYTKLYMLYYKIELLSDFHEQINLISV